jgi:hypothetical protein
MGGRRLYRLVRGGAGANLPPVAVDEMDGVVVHHPERDAGDHDGGDVHRDAEIAHDPEHGNHRQHVRHNRQQPEAEGPEHDEDDREDGHERGREAAHLRHHQVTIESAEQTAGAGRQHLDAAPREDFFCPPVRPFDLLEHEVGAHRLQLDRDLRPREIAGDDALQLVAALAAQREHEQLLGDGRRIRRHHVRVRPARVQLPVDSLQIVREGRHLPHVRSTPQLGLQLFDLLQDLGPFE